jgi:hypothetical protein
MQTQLFSPVFLETYSNVANLFVCFFVCWNILVYNQLYDGIHPANLPPEAGNTLYLSVPVIITHFMVDIFLTEKMDMRIHHLLGFLVVFYKYWKSVDITADAVPIMALYKTEISTIFYTVKTIMNIYKRGNSSTVSTSTTATPSKGILSTLFNVVYVINDLLFFGTFVKYRIFDYYRDVIANPYYYSVFRNYTDTYVLEIGMHGMFLLNLYWCSILVKIGFKPFFKNALEPATTEYIGHQSAVILMTLNLMSITCAYYPFDHFRYGLDWVGFALLSFSSNFYHTKFATVLFRDGQANYTSSELTPYFFFDLGCIHLRSWIALVAVFWYHSQDQYIRLVLSAMLHSVCYTAAVKVLRERKDEQLLADDRPETLSYIKTQYILTSVPCFLDILMICIHCRHSMASIPAFYSAICMGISLGTRPVYAYSHVLFHCFLIVMTFYMAKCNMYATFAY